MLPLHGTQSFVIEEVNISGKCQFEPLFVLCNMKSHVCVCVCVYNIMMVRTVSFKKRQHGDETVNSTLSFQDPPCPVAKHFDTMT